MTAIKHRVDAVLSVIYSCPHILMARTVMVFIVMAQVLKSRLDAAFNLSPHDAAYGIPMGCDEAERFFKKAPRSRPKGDRLRGLRLWA